MQHKEQAYFGAGRCTSA